MEGPRFLLHCLIYPHLDADCNIHRGNELVLLESTTILLTLTTTYIFLLLFRTISLSTSTHLIGQVTNGGLMLSLALSYLTLLDDDCNIHREDDDHMSLPIPFRT